MNHTIGHIHVHSTCTLYNEDELSQKMTSFNLFIYKLNHSNFNGQIDKVFTY